MCWGGICELPVCIICVKKSKGNPNCDFSPNQNVNNLRCRSKGGRSASVRACTMTSGCVPLCRNDFMEVTFGMFLKLYLVFYIAFQISLSSTDTFFEN